MRHAGKKNKMHAVCISLGTGNAMADVQEIKEALDMDFHGVNADAV